MHGDAASSFSRKIQSSGEHLARRFSQSQDCRALSDGTPPVHSNSVSDLLGISYSRSQTIFVVLNLSFLSSNSIVLPTRGWHTHTVLKVLAGNTHAHSWRRSLDTFW